MKMRPSIRAVRLITVLVFTCATGCATVAGNADPQGRKTPVPGPTLADRGEAAVEGAVLGAILGGQLGGPFGAAAGAGALLIYGAITGRVPLGGGPAAGGRPRTEREREADLESQIEQEIQRQDSLESEIEAELRRQEELLARIDQNDPRQAALDQETSQGLTEEEAREAADPRVAPLAPRDRDLPDYIFDVDTIQVPRGAWGNERSFVATRRSLDADRDGQPEEIRYFDEQGNYVRKEEDRDYDGKIDAWSSYRDGLLVSREIDANGDGRPDVWERYAGVRMTGREVDRNFDGRADAFYEYRNDSLVAEQHDTDYDGTNDFRVRYEERRRIASEEDADKDGRIDTWTTYVPDGGEDAISRIERDSTSDGKPDTFESYVRKDGETILSRREEDKNADGTIDVTSIYEDGKLVRREISDPAMMPL